MLVLTSLILLKHQVTVLSLRFCWPPVVVIVDSCMSELPYLCL